jgi:H+/Cl- antiporter ClcA
VATQDSSPTLAPTAAANAAPGSVIAIAVIAFFALLVLAGLAEGIGGFRHWVHERHLGLLPLGIVWFGAVGGSLASLTGIFWHHRVDWNDSYNLWHKLRPWTGLVMGTVGAFLLLVTTELATAGTTAARSQSAAPTKFNPDIYYAAAFLAGFAESPFRALVKRLTDAVFGPGQSPPKTDNNTHS